MGLLDDGFHKVLDYKYSDDALAMMFPVGREPSKSTYGPHTLKDVIDSIDEYSRIDEHLNPPTGNRETL